MLWCTLSPTWYEFWLSFPSLITIDRIASRRAKFHLLYGDRNSEMKGKTQMRLHKTAPTNKDYEPFLSINPCRLLCCKIALKDLKFPATQNCCPKPNATLKCSPATFLRSQRNLSKFNFFSIEFGMLLKAININIYALQQRMQQLIFFSSLNAFK